VSGIRFVSVRKLLLVFGVLSTAAAVPSAAAEKDFTGWSTMRVNHQIDDDWAIALWGQGRLANDWAEGDQLLVMPNIHYRILPGLKVGAGFTYWTKNDSTDEVDFMQEVAYSRKFADLTAGNRLRFEQRFLNNIDGAILRGRYRLQLAHPIASSKVYAIGWNEVFVNLNDKHRGPVHGYEQNRIFGGLGYRFEHRVRGELGYMWRNKDNRSGSQDDHIIALNLFFDTRGLKPPQPEAEGHH